ncbi:hypothetical protein Pelo_14187 [Pelomyxa schiedti]|nr:hypothetical protein Pelo_14187 [Pelomyxa schiedti]
MSTITQLQQLLQQLVALLGGECMSLATVSATPRLSKVRQQNACRPVVPQHPCIVETPSFDVNTSFPPVSTPIQCNPTMEGTPQTKRTPPPPKRPRSSVAIRKLEVEAARKLVASMTGMTKLEQAVTLVKKHNVTQSIVREVTGVARSTFRGHTDGKVNSTKRGRPPSLSTEEDTDSVKVFQSTSATKKYYTLAEASSLLQDFWKQTPQCNLAKRLPKFKLPGSLKKRNLPWLPDALHRIQMLLACTRGLEYAFVPDLIKVAWARTGLWPINKEAPLRSNSVIDPIEEAIAQRETSRGPPIFGTVVIPANQPTQLWAEQEQVSRKGVHQFWKEKLTTLCTVTSGVILNKLVPNQNKELTQQQAGCFVVKLPEIQNEIQTTSLLCTALGMSSLSNIPPSPHSSPLVTGGIFQLAAGAPQLANIGFHNVYF